MNKMHLNDNHLSFVPPKDALSENVNTHLFRPNENKNDFVFCLSACPRTPFRLASFRQSSPLLNESLRRD